MKWFSNLKISKKLILSFLIVIVFMGIVGFEGILNINKIDALDSQLYDDDTKPITQLSTIQVDLQKNEITIRDMIIENDVTKIKESEMLIAKTDEEINQMMSELESTLTAQNLGDEYNKLKTAMTNYEPVKANVMTLANQNKDEEAFTLMSGEGSALSKTIDNLAANLISLKETQGFDKSETNRKTATSASTSMLIIIIVGIVVSILLVYIISGIIGKPIKRMLYMIEEMGKGHLSERSKINTKDEIGQMAKAVDSFANLLQTKLIAEMHNISNGDVSTEITGVDEKDELSPALKITVETIRNLKGEIEKLIKAAKDGKLDTRGNADPYSGTWKDFITGINGLIDALVSPINVTAEYVERISKGDIPPKITDVYLGDFNEIKNNLNNCIDVMDGLLGETNNLITAAKEGKLATRGNSKAFAGEWVTLVEGINQLIEALVSPINITSDYITRISKGDIPPKITDVYYGDFNVIKENLNNCIDVMNTLLNEMDSLIHSAGEGELDTRANAAAFEGEWERLVGGVNKIVETVVRPIKEVTLAMNELSQGNLNISVNGTYKGEFRILTLAVNTTVEKLQGVVAEISKILGEISNGNIDIEDVNAYEGDFESISSSLNTIVASLNSVMTDINVAAEQVSTGSGQVSDGSQALSQGATEQASSIEELTSSITEIAAQTKANASNANQANQLALNVKTNAEQGNGHMGEMLKAMGEINESSANISKIIKVIDDIAFQTNILALNAAVEAARAGQHGKGFAVVAEEVRNLAARSANAAKETTALIEGSIKKAEKGTDIANNTAKALNDIVEGVSKTVDLVGEIAASSNEQATGISQVNLGIEQVSQVVQTNSATAEESAAASEELSSQAELLKEKISQFKLKNSRNNMQKNDSKRQDTKIKESTHTFKETSAASNKPKIALSDKEFGKY